MQTREKPFYKTLLFWELAVGGMVMLAAMILMIVELRHPPA